MSKSLVDIYSRSKRSSLMSGIRSKNTGPELKVRKYLHCLGFRFRLHDKRYPGKPDILLPKYKTAVFVNGCFWHGHDCPAAKLPSTRTDFWESKINHNKIRDKLVIAQLESLGLKVIVIWQCKLKNKELENSTLYNLQLQLKP